LVKRDTAAERIDIYTKLNAVTVKIGFDKPITISSLYMDAYQRVTKEQLIGLADDP
jgi:hypothetical protein